MIRILFLGALCSLLLSEGVFALPTSRPSTELSTRPSTKPMVWNYARVKKWPSDRKLCAGRSRKRRVVFPMPKIEALAVHEARNGHLWFLLRHSHSDGYRGTPARRHLVMKTSPSGRRIWVRDLAKIVKPSPWLRFALSPRGEGLIVTAKQWLRLDQEGGFHSLGLSRFSSMKIHTLAYDAGGDLWVAGVKQSTSLGTKGKAWLAKFSAGKFSTGMKLQWQRLSSQGDEWNVVALHERTRQGLVIGTSAKVGGRAHWGWFAQIFDRKGRRLAKPKLPVRQWSYSKGDNVLAGHDPQTWWISGTSVCHLGRGWTSCGTAHIAKIDASGRLLQYGRYPGSNTLQQNHLALLPKQQGLLVASQQVTYAGPEGQGYAALLRLDRHGRWLWGRKFTQGEQSRAFSLIPLQSGGYAFTGWIQRKRERFPWIVWLDETGCF